MSRIAGLDVTRADDEVLVDLDAYNQLRRIADSGDHPFAGLPRRASTASPVTT